MRQAGDRVPQTTFRLRRNGRWLERTSDEIFAGRNVVVFAVPAAFSTACSARHLPGYVTLAKNFKAMGVDEVCYVSVNDAFVMNAWARDQGIDGEVTLLPDGDGAFTRAMGMLADRCDQGFGLRSWRYAMLVRDGVIASIFVEDAETGGDPVEISDAITMLDFLDGRTALAAAE